MVTDGAGRIIVTGLSGPTSNYDCLTLKYENCGALQWANRYDASIHDMGYGVTLDKNSEIIVAGEYYTNVVYDFQYLTLKYYSDGTQHWVKTDGGFGEELFKKVVTDNSGNIYLAGESTHNDYPAYFNYQMTLWKKDASGNTVWSKYYGTSSIDQILNDLTIDANGYIYITGASIGTYGYDFTTVKYDASGNQIWAATYNGTGNSDDISASIAVDNSGNVYVTGISWEGPPTKDAVSQDCFTTIKYNSSGAQQWVNKYYGTGTNRYAGGLSIALDNNNNVYATGFAHINSGFNDYVTIKYNSSGTQQWASSYDYANGNDVAKYIKSDNNGYVYITGYSSNDFSQNNAKKDYATIKYDALTGASQWSIRYDGTGFGHDEPYGLALSDGGVYVTGKSVGTGNDFDYLTIRYSDAWPVCNPGGDVNGSILNSASKLNDSSAVIVGEHGTILKTNNYGLNWNAVSNNQQQRYNKVHFLNSSLGIISGDSGSVLYTTNGGNNWVSRNAPTDNEIKSVQIINLNLIYAVGLRGLILKTTNAGNTWVNLSTDTSSTLHSVHFTSPSKGFATGSNGLLLRTINSGSNWSKVSSNTINDLKEIQFSDSLNGIIIGNSGTILLTTNGGNSWSSSQQQFNYDLNEVYFISKDTVYIAGNSGLILCSVNRGRTWKQQNTSVAYNLKSVLFWNNSRGMAAGDNGNVILTSLGERYDNAGADKVNTSQSLKNTLTKNDFHLLQNYPNPFNPETEITYTLPENSRVKLIVYNLMGQAVNVIANGFKHAGAYTAKFNGSNLASGIYFYNLVVFDENGINEKFNVTKKMILVK